MPNDDSKDVYVTSAGRTAGRAELADDDVDIDGELGSAGLPSALGWQAAVTASCALSSIGRC